MGLLEKLLAQGVKIAGSVEKAGQKATGAADELGTAGEMLNLVQSGKATPEQLRAAARELLKTGEWSAPKAIARDAEGRTTLGRAGAAGVAVGAVAAASTAASADETTPAAAPRPMSQSLSAAIWNPASRQYEYPMDTLYAERANDRTASEYEAHFGAGGSTDVEEPKAPKVSASDQLRSREAVLAEPDVKAAVDTLKQYREMRSAEGPEGGVYNADELGRQGFKDRGPAKDPIEFVTGLIEDAFKFSSPDIKGGTPATPGDIKGLSAALKTVTGALKKMTLGGKAAGEAAGAAGGAGGAGAAGGARAPGDGAPHRPSADVKAGPQAMAGVNPSRMEGSPPDVQAVIKNIGDFNATRMEQGVVTHAETIAKAERAMSLDETLNLDPAKHDLATMQTAVAGHFKASVGYFQDVAKRVLAGDPAAKAEYWGAFAVASDLAQKDALLGTQVGRGLEARKIRLEELRGSIAPEQLQEMAQRMAGGLEAGMDVERHAERMLQLTPAQRETAMRQTATFLKAGQSALYEAWINGLLSGPQTHAANMLSNALTAAWAPGERLLAATLDIGALGGDRSVYFGESAQMLYGLVEGAKDGLRLMGKAITEGAGGAGQKIERAPSITAQAFGLNPEGVVGSAVDFMGAIIRTPGRALVAEDEFFKAVNYRMELRALAYREAAGEGLSGSAFSKRVQQIIADPPPAVKSRADAFALAQTFNQNLDELGPMAKGLGKGAQAFADNVPMGRLILPFVRTPANILNFAADRTPILNLAATNLRAELAAGGERRALAMGKVAAGGMVSAVVASYAGSAINPDNPVPYMTVVTGEGPTDAAQRGELKALGWAPYSIWDGDKYVAYKRLDPLGTVLGIVASGSEIMGQLPENGASELAAAMSIAVGKAMISKTFLTGLSDFLEAQQGHPEKMKKFYEGLARSGVPAAVRQTSRTLDPTLREMDTLFEQWRSGLPGYDGPPVLNLWGDPVILGGGLGPDIISPLYTSPVKPDAVTEWLLQNRVPVKGAPKVVGGTMPPGIQLTEPTAAVGIKLTKEEHHRLGLLMGKGGEAPSIGPDMGGMGGLPPLKDAIREIIAGPGTGGPDGSKADLIRQRVQDYKRAAVLQLRRESPMLDDALSDLERKRIDLKANGPENAQPKQPEGLGNLLNLLGTSLGR